MGTGVLPREPGCSGCRCLGEGTTTATPQHVSGTQHPFPSARLVSALNHTPHNSIKIQCIQLQSLVQTESCAWGVLKLCPGVLPEIHEIPPGQGLEEKSQQMISLSRIFRQRMSSVLSEARTISNGKATETVSGLFHSFIHLFIRSY